MKFNYLHFCCILLLLLNISFTQAQTYVNTSVIGGSNNGSSWSNAYADLAAALANASAEEEFWVAEGSYYPTSGSNRGVSFSVSVQGVEIYGGFISGHTNLNQRDWVNNPTILSGDIGEPNLKTDNSYSIFTIAQTVTTLTLDGVTVQDGHSSAGSGIGGGIYINAYSTSTGSTPVFNNCIFKDNYALSSGGAIYVEAGNGGFAFPAFNNCTFHNNESGSSGGAVYHSAYNGNISSTFSSCTFSNNLSGASGGAIFNHGGLGGNANPVFKQCNFDSNVSIENGGAIYNLGTISNGNSNPIIINCQFYNNSGYAAGGIYNNGTNTGNSSPTITNCTFVNNYTTDPAGNGGAIYCNGSQTGNSSAIITNCLFWGNEAPNGSEVIRSVDGAPVLSYCLVDTTSCIGIQSGPNITCGAGMIYNQIPLFTNLASGDLSLLSSSSPAADQGLNSANSELTDLIGADRVSNTTIDIGAYEFENLGALPIELISFRANYQQDRVRLSWVTANEINNEYFTIQYSVDGVYFQDVENINGAENSTVIQSYFAFHQQPASGINYYRLKQTDFDGTSSLSNIEAVKVFGGKMNAFPNPVINEINISFADFEKGKIDFAIYNIYGKEIFSQQVNIEDSLHIINLSEVVSFLPGTYFIKIFNEASEIYVHKFQKVVD